MNRTHRTAKRSRLQIALDQEVGFVNRIDSRIANIHRSFDDKTGEYIIWIEYRTRVRPGVFKEHAEQKPLISVISDIF